MNKHSHEVGCMVPLCEQKICNRKMKGSCALRKYFLMDIKEKKQRLALIRDLLDAAELIEWKKSIYFWRRGTK